MDNQKPVRTAVQKSVATAVLDGIAAGGTSLVSLLSGLLAAFLILYSGFVLYDTQYTYDNAGNTWELLQYKPEIIQDNPQPVEDTAPKSLAEITEDYRAWLTIYDTTIDYPVMQGPNDLYYAARDIYGNPSLTGAIYLAAANAPDFSDNYNLIYGHHLDRDAMFGGLDNFTEEEYFSQHREGVVVTPTKVYDLKIFAAIYTDAYEDMVYEVGGDRDLSELISFLEENHIIYDGSVLEGAEKIIALSTCADATTSGRLVVFAVMTERKVVPVPPPGPDDPIPHPDDPVTPDKPSADNPYTPTPDEPVIPDEDITPDNPPVPDNPTSSDSPTTGLGDDEIIPGNPVEPIKPVAGIEDRMPSIAKFIARFTPQGNAHRSGSWALVNLIAMIVTVYLFLPLLHLRAKYGRRGMMKKVNKSKRALRELPELAESQQEEKARIDRQALADRRADGGTADPDDAVTEKEFNNAVEELYYRLKNFTRRSRTGYVLELLIAAAAVITFILTEDMRLPMVLIDKWTPLMLLILAVNWVVDVRLARYRSKAVEEEEAPQDAPQEPANV